MKKILINAQGREVRIALLEEGNLKELLIERKSKRGLTGNIYKGRVVKLVPAVQAAFVDIGLSKKAFLYVKDTLPNSGAEELPPIEEVVKVGEELLVQVAKEPLGTKGPRITKNITLPGHYLVLLPERDGVNISRRIEEEEERERLLNIAEEIKPENFGLIVRTAAEGATKEELKRDLEYLLNLWNEIERAYREELPPALLYRELDVVCRALRDLAGEDVKEILIDDEEEFKEAVSFAEKYIPKLRGRIKLYRGKIPLFKRFGLEESIKKALSKKVRLSGGGYIVIEETEALVSIDVNSGKFKKSSSIEETALEINLKAAREIAHQLRLRNIGGIIVIDFIDLKEEENRKLLLEEFERELKKDRVRTKIVSMSELGLVEMTRKRAKKSLNRLLTVSCPYCDGSGRVKSVETVVFEIERELLNLSKEERVREVRVYANPEVCSKLKEFLFLFKEGAKLEVKLIPVEHYHVENYLIQPSS